MNFSIQGFQWLMFWVCLGGVSTWGFENLDFLGVDEILRLQVGCCTNGSGEGGVKQKGEWCVVQVGCGGFSHKEGVFG